MKERDLQFVQDQIKYTFRNISLLNQAFTRITNDNINTSIHNDMLEFYGDKILGFILAKKFCSENSRLSLKGNFLSEMTAGMLSEEYVKYSRNDYLAERIEKLGFRSVYLRNLHHNHNFKSVNTKAEGDLFEAILGAIAVDSNWDCEVLDKVIERMIIENLSEDCSKEDLTEFAQNNNLGNVEFSEKETGKAVSFTVRFSNLSKEFTAVSKKASEAESSACRKAVNFFEYVISGVWPEGKNYKVKLAALSDLRIIPSPEYVNSVQEKDGRECWITTCHVEGFEDTAGMDFDFDKSERMAAESMLKSIFDITPKELPESEPETEVEEADDAYYEEEESSEPELNYISQLYLKVDKNEISLPEFSFETIDGIITCRALIDGDTYMAQNETRQSAKKDVCKQILDEFNNSYSQYFV